MTILCGILVAQKSDLRAHHSRRYLAFLAGSTITTAHSSHALQQPPLKLPQHKPPPYESKCLDQVEITVQKVLDKHSASHDILNLSPPERQAVGVARNLHKRLTALSRNNDCRRCWLQQKHCICSQCPPLEGSIPKIWRLFLLIHHKEVCLAVDTARLILSSFPDTCRLVVGGIGPEFQESMAEMLDAVQNERNCLVLFPADNAKTFGELEASSHLEDNIGVQSSTSDERWDVIVIDGTWSQARKLHARYIPLETGGGPPIV
jgi:DTW domain-containing protein YfiP